MLETLKLEIFSRENAYFIKSSFLRSMFEGVENESKNDGLGRRKGRTNQGKLDASTHQKIIEKLVV